MVFVGVVFGESGGFGNGGEFAADRGRGGGAGSSVGFYGSGV